jgi:hypothetical protein
MKKIPCYIHIFFLLLTAYYCKLKLFKYAITLKTLRFLPTDRIYVCRMILRIKIDHFPKQHKQISL